MSRLTPAALAVRDQQMADCRKALSLLVSGAKFMLGEGDDPADVMSLYAEASTANLADGSMTQDFLTRVMAMAVVRLAEAGEPS